jgi:hypothetical protein
MFHEFDVEFRKWVSAASAKWHYKDHQQNEYYEKIYARLGSGLCEALALGIREGIILTQGYAFRLKGLPAKKGPYKWFGPSSSGAPSPYWEYYVQAAEYVRLFGLATQRGLQLTFEDGLMDLALYGSGQLLVYCEVKQHPAQIEALIKGIRNYEQEIDYSRSDRGNDPLRKAKYIKRKKPLYFCGSAAGIRAEYRVDYPKGWEFRLQRDLIPWV